MLDFILLVDNSGSMGLPSHRVAGATRLSEVQQDVQKTAEIAEQFDSDGLTVIEFASDAQVFDGVGSLKVASTFKSFGPKGTTNLTAGLRLAVAKAKASSKNCVIVVYTDGQPDDQTTATRVIDQAGRELGRPKIGFTFVQVGNDASAAAFLKHLDENMKVDVVATVRAEEATNLTVHQLAWLAQNA